MKNQIKCPECKSYRIEEKNNSKAFSFIGTVFMVLGIILIICSTATIVIGFPILLIGLIISTKGIFFTPWKRECKCLNCGYKFIREDDESSSSLKTEEPTVSDNKHENNYNDFEKSVEQLNQKIINPKDDTFGRRKKDY